MGEQTKSLTMLGICRSISWKNRIMIFRRKGRRGGKKHRSDQGNRTPQVYDGYTYNDVVFLLPPSVQCLATIVR